MAASSGCELASDCTRPGIGSDQHDIGQRHHVVSPDRTLPGTSMHTHITHSQHHSLANDAFTVGGASSSHRTASQQSEYTAPRHIHLHSATTPSQSITLHLHLTPALHHHGPHHGSTHAELHAASASHGPPEGSTSTASPSGEVLLLDQTGDGGGAVRAPTSPRSSAPAAEEAGVDLFDTQFDIAAAAAAVLDLMNQLGVSGATESNASKVARLANRQAVSAGLDWRAPGRLRQPTGLETQGEIGLLIAHAVLRRRQPHILFESGNLVVQMGELLGKFAFRSASAKRRRREASAAKLRACLRRWQRSCGCGRW